MEKTIYTFQPHKPFGIKFGIAKTLTGTYVCPGWYPVPNGTTKDQIKFDISAIPPKQEHVITQVSKWEVPGSKPGVMYTIMRGIEDNFNCSCPAFSFRRGECKHIKSIRESLSNI